MSMSMSMMMGAYVPVVPALPGNMWVTDNVSDTLSKIDSAGTVTAYTSKGYGVNKIEFDGTDMWLADPTYISNQNLLRISPAGTTLANIANIPHGLTRGQNEFWVSDNWGYVLTIPSSGTGSTPLFYTYPQSANRFTLGGANMWAIVNGANTVWKMTLAGAFVAYTGTGVNPTDIAFDGTNAWTCNGDATVSRITPAGTITNYSGLPAASHAIAFDGTNMWVTCPTNLSVSKVSPAGTITTYVSATVHPYGIAFDGANMWVTTRSDSKVSKISSSGTFTDYTGLGSSPDCIAFDGALLSHWWGGS